MKLHHLTTFILLASSMSAFAKDVKKVEHTHCKVNNLLVSSGNQFGRYGSTDMEDPDTQEIKALLETKGYIFDEEFQKSEAGRSNKESTGLSITIFNLYQTQYQQQQQRQQQQRQQSQNENLLDKMVGGTMDLVDGSVNIANEVADYVYVTSDNLISNATNEIHYYVGANGVAVTYEKNTKFKYPVIINMNSTFKVGEKKREISKEIREFRSEIRTAKKEIKADKKLLKELSLDPELNAQDILNAQARISLNETEIAGKLSFIDIKKAEKAMLSSIPGPRIAIEEKKESETLTIYTKKLAEGSKTYLRDSDAKDPKFVLEFAQKIPECVVNPDMKMKETVQKKWYQL